MGKGRIFGSVLAFVFASLVPWGAGCGQSNDQGISFRSLGFFGDPGDGTVGDSGREASLSFDNQIPNNIDDDPELDGCFLGLHNNMNLGLQVDRVDITYRVVGSNVAVPSVSFALSQRLGPSSGQEVDSAPTTFTQIFVVPPTIFDFIRRNRSAFPAAPFTLVATTVAVATSDAGDTFFTNKSSYEVEFFD